MRFTPEYIMECHRCGLTGDNDVFGFGNARRCPDCGSTEVHGKAITRRGVAEP